MAGWFTRRRSIGVLIAVLVIGGLAGGVGLRASKRAAAEAADKAATVALEFAAADLAFVEPAALRAGFRFRARCSQSIRPRSNRRSRARFAKSRSARVRP